MDNRIEITLTQFVDFSLRQQGTSRVNCVRKIKHQPPYHPAKDFWKQLRDTIHDMHVHGYAVEKLPQLMPPFNERKKALYIEAINQYVKLMRKHKTEWFDSGKSYWSTESLLVRTSPELGLIIDGHPRLVKLYFKGHGEKATKRSISQTLTMMSTSEYQSPRTDVLPAVISTAQSRIFLSDTDPTSDDQLALKSDAQQFSFIWHQV